jgi:xylulokinase
MAASYFLGIDIGTSSTKVGLWRADGTLITRASASYTLQRPHPTWADIPAADWWQATCETVQQVTREVDATEIGGVGVDGLGWALVPVDDRGQPLANAMIWLDRRAEAQAARLRALPQAAALVDLVANPLDAAYITPKLLWLKENAPDVYERTHKFLTSSGYIVQQLTGQFTCDYTQAYGYHCFDIRREQWDAQAANWLGLSLDQFPTLHAPTDIVGAVTPAAAAATGLRAGTPVIAGALDAAAGAFGSGVARPGQTSDQGGTAFGLSNCTDHVLVEPRLIFSHHVVPGTYLLQGGTVGGGVLNWFRSEFGDESFESLSEQAARSAVGANGVIFLPYMSGERSPLWNSSARGVFFGLSYNTRRHDVVRSIMEGCALAVYHNMQVAQESGAHIDEWIGIGGASSSAVWCQIKADITDRPFIISRQPDGTRGDNTLALALMVAYAVGAVDNLADQIDAVLSERRQYTPDKERHAQYQQIFDFYLHLAHKLEPDFDRLIAMQQEQL